MVMASVSACLQGMVRRSMLAGEGVARRCKWGLSQGSGCGSEGKSWMVELDV